MSPGYLPPCPYAPRRRMQSAPLRCRRCSAWRGRCPACFPPQPLRSDSAALVPSPAASLRGALSTHQIHCVYPYGILPVRCIGVAVSDFSHSCDLIERSLRRFPISLVVVGVAPERDRSAIIRLAIPNPPCALTAFPSASEAKLTIASPEPASSSSLSRPLLVMGFSNSFIICASNSR